MLHQFGKNSNFKIIWLSGVFFAPLKNSMLWRKVYLKCSNRIRLSERNSFSDNLYLIAEFQFSENQNLTLIIIGNHSDSYSSRESDNWDSRETGVKYNKLIGNVINISHLN